MKQFLFLALTCLLLAFSACKKDDGTPSADESSLSVKIDGADFKSEGLAAYATNFSTEFTIYGIKDINSSAVNLLYFSLPLGSKAGTYNLDGNNKGYYIDGSGGTFSTAWGAGSGTVTIEEIDAAHVKGTFQYNAFNSVNETQKKSLTEGKFNVAFR